MSIIASIFFYSDTTSAMFSKLVRSFATLSQARVVAVRLPAVLPSVARFSTTALRPQDATATSAAKEKANSDQADGEGAKESDGSGSGGGRWTGKNAWKLGLLSLSFSGVAMFTSLIFIWGEFPSLPLKTNRVTLNVRQVGVSFFQSGGHIELQVNILEFKLCGRLKNVPALRTVCFSRSKVNA